MKLKWEEEKKNIEKIQKLKTKIDEVNAQIENAENANVAIYSVGGVLYVDGLSADYQVFDVNGRLVYTGRDAQLSLPRGVYMIVIGNQIQKVVL